MTKSQIPPFGLRMPPDFHMWIKMKARIEGRSMNNLLVQIIRDAMEEDNAAA